MAPRRTLDDVFANLARVRESPRSEESLAALRAALASASSFAAAKAARLASELELADLGPDLIAAYDHFGPDGAEDPGCTAKAAVAE